MVVTLPEPPPQLTAPSATTTIRAELKAKANLVECAVRFRAPQSSAVSIAISTMSSTGNV